MAVAVMGGLLKRLALEPDFDAEGETEQALALSRPWCNGALAPAGRKASR
jgi:hypothetical protein